MHCLALAPRIAIHGLSANMFFLDCSAFAPASDVDILELFSDKLSLLHSDFTATITIKHCIKMVPVEISFEKNVWLKDFGIAIGKIFDDSNACLIVNSLEIYNTKDRTFCFNPVDFDTHFLLSMENGKCVKKIRTVRTTELKSVEFLGTVSDVPTIKIDTVDLLLL